MNGPLSALGPTFQAPLQRAQAAQSAQATQAKPVADDPKTTTLSGSEARTPDVKEVAQQFEALLLQQLVSTLRESAKADSEAGGGGGTSNQLVDQTIEEGLANHLARAGGIGLVAYLERATEPHPTHSPPVAIQRFVQGGLIGKKDP